MVKLGVAGSFGLDDGVDDLVDELLVADGRGEAGVRVGRGRGEWWEQGFD